jgi:hypothetical protein
MKKRNKDEKKKEGSTGKRKNQETNRKAEHRPIRFGTESFPRTDDTYICS